MNKYTDIEIKQFSSSTKDIQFLLSYNGIHYEANASIVELLEYLQKYSDEDEAITAYINKKNEKYTVEQIREIIEKYITPIFAPKEKKRTFLYEKELFSASVISKFSNTFKFLFNKIFMSVVLIATIVIDTYFFYNTTDLLTFNSSVNVYVIIGLFVFMLVSSFLHELGHATACKYFGQQHGGVGFGLYLNFPVFYTDVSEVWKLNRLQRCVVNIAGVYFQSFILIILITAFLLTNNDIIRYIILTMNFGFIMTLNPFFRFDGYWIASDLLGVPNLRARSMEYLKYLYKRIRKQPITQQPYLMKIRSIEKYGLLVYSFVVNLFMGYYFFYIIPKFMYKFIQTFPDEINELIMYLSNRITPPFALLRNIVAQLLFVALVGYMVWKMLSPIVKKHVGKQS